MTDLVTLKPWKKEGMKTQNLLHIIFAALLTLGG